jgi:K+-sensing histidine kinase KdpD
MVNGPWTIEDRLGYLERRIAVLERMSRLSRLITSTLDLHRLLDIITEAGAELANTEAAAIALFDDQRNELYFEAVSGPKKEEIKRFTIPLEGSLAGWVFTHNESVIIHNAQEDPRHSGLVDSHTGFQTRSLIQAPLTVRGAPLGVIMAVSYSEETRFNDDDLQVLTSLATQAAVAIENARLFEAQREIVFENARLFEAQTRAYAALAKANERLQELDKLKSAFIGVITHELRTPIANLDFSLQLLERYGTADWQQEQRDQLVQLKEGIASTERTVDNLVSFATYLSKRGELNLEWVDLGALIQDTIEPLRSLAESKGISFQTQVSSALKVHVDRERLSDAVYHLVENAVKFTEQSGSIWVRCHAKSDQVHFVVQDTGVGIPEDKLPQLWSGFAQMADPVLRGVEGLGLGLALVQYIVSAHNGHVYAKSQEGMGSVFGFQIPQDLADSQKPPVSDRGT